MNRAGYQRLGEDGIDVIDVPAKLARRGFASFCGVAPIEVSSGDVVRHRLSRAGTDSSTLRLESVDKGDC